MLFCITIYFIYNLSSVRYNSTKSKMFYCLLILFSALHVQLIWQYFHCHLPQLHHFFSKLSFRLSEVNHYQVHLNYLYLNFTVSHEIHHKYDEHHFLEVQGAAPWVEKRLIQCGEGFLVTRSTMFSSAFRRIADFSDNVVTVGIYRLSSSRSLNSLWKIFYTLPD